MGGPGRKGGHECEILLCSCCVFGNPTLIPSALNFPERQDNTRTARHARTHARKHARTHARTIAVAVGGARRRKTERTRSDTCQRQKTQREIHRRSFTERRDERRNRSEGNYNCDARRETVFFPVAIIE